MNSYWWLPRLNGAVNGVYASVPPGGLYYYTDLDRLPPPDPSIAHYYYPLALEQDFPEKVLLQGVHIEFGYSGEPNPAYIPGVSDPNETVPLWLTKQQVNIYCFLDPKGQYYRSANGVEVGSTFTKSFKLMSAVWKEDEVDPSKCVNYSWNGGQPFFLPEPILWDRSKDHFSVTTGHNHLLDFVQASIYWKPV